MFKKGDKIKVIDDDQKGVVIGVEKNRIKVMTEFGFEDSFYAHELILDKPLEVGEVKVVKTETFRQKPKKLPKNEPKEIDLHIGQLVDSFIHLSNYEMLQIQLQKVRDEIELAKKERRSRLIFIHGHGTGKLRDELHNLLLHYKGLEFYDASFRKYKLGATEVRLF